MNRRTVKTVTLVAMLATLMLPALSAQAAGSNYVYGEAYGYVIQYNNPRTVTVDTEFTSGPSVAHYQQSGPGGLRMAAWACRGSGAYWDDFYDQEVGYVRRVADGIPANQQFCVATYSTVGTGNWDGTLYWD